MKLDDVEASGIEDRTGSKGRIPGGKGAKVGIPGVIIAVIIAVVSQAGGGGGGGGAGTAIGEVLGQLAQGGAAGSASGSVPETAGTDLEGQQEFAGKMDTLLTEYWKPTFQGSGAAFQDTVIVVFDGPTQTGGCGVGQPQAGPFYCPGDSKIYIDFAFYEQLEEQLGFDGDFAMAYVLAHEYGHHIQNVLGINEDVRTQSSRASQEEANALSVKLELQADCFAGAWAKSVSDDGRLDAGDFDEAIRAASAVGDDAIQGEGAARETFTHGSSAERQQWFQRGFAHSDPSDCDTFAS